jgi:pimeloyl-ACP methyl ester carboxylesterase
VVLFRLLLFQNFLTSTSPTHYTMPNTKTIHVPHLGGIEASYQSPNLSTSKPTLVLVNSFTTSSELYKTQYANKNLTDKMNLLAIELLGHGQTRCKLENWTYWDTAWMNIQVLQELEKQGKIDQSKGIFVLGTSQGGWITVRMALMAPGKVSTNKTMKSSKKRGVFYSNTILTVKKKTDHRYNPPRHKPRLRIPHHTRTRLLERTTRPDSRH